jgi:hypothetical protein
MAKRMTHRRKSHRSKTRGGSSCGKVLSGGKRNKTRKMSKGASEWNKKVMEVYHELKKKNSNVKLGDAMKEAASRKKKGTL